MRGNDTDGFFSPRPYSCRGFNTPTLCVGVVDASLSQVNNFYNVSDGGA